MRPGSEAGCSHELSRGDRSVRHFHAGLGARCPRMIAARLRSLIGGWLRRSESALGRSRTVTMRRRWNREGSGRIGAARERARVSPGTPIGCCERAAREGLVGACSSNELIARALGMDARFCLSEAVAVARAARSVFPRRSRVGCLVCASGWGFHPLLKSAFPGSRPAERASFWSPRAGYMRSKGQARGLTALGGLGCRIRVDRSAIAGF